MRWEALFADLEGQLAAAEVEPGLAAERARAEAARTVLADRLRAHRGVELRVRLRSGDLVTGSVLDAGPDWLLLADGRVEVLVPGGAVAAVGGLSRAVAPPPGQVERRLGLGSALRALARDRAAVRLLLVGSTVTGTVDRVGADHLDLAEHPVDEPRRARAVREVVTVPFAALLAVRSG